VVETDLRLADSLGLTGTPSVFVGGRLLRGTPSFETIARELRAIEGENRR
jgi:protein-disulfide isomerase